MVSVPDIMSVVLLIALLISTSVGVRRLLILQTRHRFDTAPFVTIDIESSTKQKPGDIAEHLLNIDKIKQWGKARSKAPHRYLVLRLQNKQSHIGGAAVDVSFRATLSFPQYGTPNTQIEVPRHITGKIWLETEEIYRFIFADLKGVPAATIDIDKIEYYDVDQNKYTRTYGYCHWALDNTGTEHWKFISCGK